MAVSDQRKAGEQQAVKADRLQRSLVFLFFGGPAPIGVAVGAGQRVVVDKGCGESWPAARQRQRRLGRCPRRE